MCIYEDYLNDNEPDVKIAGLSFGAGSLLRRGNPEDFRILKADFISSEIENWLQKNRISWDDRFAYDDKVITAYDYAQSKYNKDETPDFDELESLDAEEVHETEEGITVFKIAGATFWEMLGCLPPENWHNFRGINFFQMCEYNRTTPDGVTLTEYYAATAHECFNFEAPIFLTPEQVAKILDF